MTGILDIGIDLLISSALALPFLIYAWSRNKELKRKLGVIHSEFVREKVKKLHRYRFVLLPAIALVGSSVSFGVSHLLDHHSHSTPFGLLSLFLVVDAFMVLYTIRIGENGFVLNNRYFSWRQVERVEWDRDLGQIGWGFKVLLKGKKEAVRGMMEREFQPQADELFKKFLKTEKESEAVPA